MGKNQAASQCPLSENIVTRPYLPLSLARNGKSSHGKIMKNAPILLTLSLLAAGWSVLAADKKIDFNKLDLSKLPPTAAKKGVTYAKDIRPLFEASCFRCHGEEKQKGELRLDSLEAALKGGEDGKVVIPGDSKKSVLVVAVAQIDEEFAMPPKPKPGGPGEFLVYL